MVPHNLKDGSGKFVHLALTLSPNPTVITDLTSYHVQLPNFSFNKDKDAEMQMQRSDFHHETFNSQ